MRARNPQPQLGRSGGNAIVDKGAENKTWQKYRLRNPRLRYFDDPIIDKVVRPAMHTDAAESSALSAGSVVSETTNTQMKRPMPTSPAKKVFQETKKNWLLAPMKRYTGPGSWIAVAALGASALLMLGPFGRLESFSTSSLPVQPVVRFENA